MKSSFEKDAQKMIVMFMSFNTQYLLSTLSTEQYWTPEK